MTAGTRPIRVLIVEDTANDAALMVAELERAGLVPEWHRVDSEAGFLAALDPALDVVLSDFNVPGFGAMRALALLKASGLDIPFIVVSGSIGEETAVKLLRGGAADYLLKDRMGRLGQAVTRLLDERQLQREKHEATAALSDTQQRMRFTLDATGVGIWDLDFATGEARWSETLELLHGLQPGRFGGSFEAFLNLVHASDRPQVEAAIALSREAHIDTNVEYRTQWPDGSIHWMVSKGRTDYDENGKPIRASGIGIDMTERRKLEEQYRQAQKMEAVGQLAGGVAHDFNNLLTAIHGYVELMAESLGSQPPYAEYLAELRQAAMSATSLTRQLLAFSRRQILEPCVLDLGDALRAVEPILKRLIGEDITVTVAIADGSRRVRADPGQIEQIIMNLAVNARDAMPDGGSLHLSVAGTPAGDQVMLSVSDTGMGMDQATQARVFEPFFTTKAKGRGTGLGLSTVYGIVEQSGGTIALDSAPGKGTTFRVCLARVDSPLSQLAVRRTQKPAGGSETILVVEDDSLVRELVKTILDRAGYRVTVCSTPTEALLHVQAATDPIHLLITDVVLPEMNGRVLATHVVAARPEIRVLFMSGYIDSAIVERGIQMGVADERLSFISKPFTPDHLALKVREVLTQTRSY